ncbi:hypothetical protein BDR22DRAFT_316775 [Usnea florida]
MYEIRKTMLSRSIVGQLDHQHLAIWLEAGSSHSLEENLKGAAISLRHELLRGAHERDFYYPAGPAKNEYLVELLKVWLSMAQARVENKPQVLLVIDDVDGLVSSKLTELSKMVAGDGIDIIFNTRDPTIADRASILSATNFDVPPLQQDQALDLLYDPTTAKSSTETEFLSANAVKFGFLPAALVTGSQYLKVHLASRSPYAVNSYHAKWNSDLGRREILQFRRLGNMYPHTMHSSFQVSMERLRRNTKAESPTLYVCCLNLLRLLSALEIDCFARSELESLSNLLRLFIKETMCIGQADGELTGLRLSLRQLSEDAGKAPRCATELVRVSLLTTPEGTETLALNKLTMACVMLRPAADRDDWHLEFDWELALTERVLLQRAASYISETWVPCLPLPKTVGQTAF